MDDSQGGNEDSAVQDTGTSYVHEISQSETMDELQKESLVLAAQIYSDSPMSERTDHQQHSTSYVESHLCESLANLLVISDGSPDGGSTNTKAPPMTDVLSKHRNIEEVHDPKEPDERDWIPSGQEETLAYEEPEDDDAGSDLMRQDRFTEDATHSVASGVDTSRQDEPSSTGDAPNSVASASEPIVTQQPDDVPDLMGASNSVASTSSNTDTSEVSSTERGGDEENSPVPSAHTRIRRVSRTPQWLRDYSTTSN
jgi:hypothetical protein